MCQAGNRKQIKKSRKTEEKKKYRDASKAFPQDMLSDREDQEDHATG